MTDGPTCSGVRVDLRPVVAADLPYLYALAVDPELSFKWRMRGQTPSPEQFQAELFVGVHAQFVVHHRESGRPLGLVVAYRMQADNGHCYLGLVGDDDTGALMEGMVVFLSYLFESWPLRKVYAEVPGYALDQFASGVDRYFDEEGRLTEHDFFKGQYWDLHVLAITRSRWEDIDARLQRMVDKVPVEPS
jgi:hypothetical protein